MAHHPTGALEGSWDIVSSLRCPIRPHPSFGSRPKVRGRWFDRGDNLYDMEFTIRAGGNGATSGSGLWLVNMPVLGGYKLYLNPPSFNDGSDVNSYMIGFAQVGTGTGAHLGVHTVHTRSSSPRLALDESQLVFAKPGGLFLGAGGWVPANVHFATHRPFRGVWRAV